VSAGDTSGLWPAKLTTIVLTATSPRDAADYWAGLLGGAVDGSRVLLGAGTSIDVREGGAAGLHEIRFEATEPFVRAARDAGGASAAHERETVELTDPDRWRLRFTGVDAVPPVELDGVVLSHCTLNSPDPNAQRAYYERLRFRLSDALGDIFSWLRCNPVHHAVAFAAHPRAAIHHLAVELPDRASFIGAIDRAVAAGCTLEFGPGRHLVGGNLFAYLRDRYGLRWELCSELRRIEDPAYQPTPLTAHDRSRSVNTFGPPPPPSFIDEAGGPGPLEP
jgi:catechol 2,3-dioxygenase-like lactoylglutathione lyase family enzyme